MRNSRRRRKALEEGQGKRVSRIEGGDREGPAGIRQVIMTSAAVVVNRDASLGQQGEVPVQSAKTAPASIGESTSAQMLLISSRGGERDDLEETGKLI